MRKIEKFIKKLKNIDNFPISAYNFENYRCLLAFMHYADSKKEFDKIKMIKKISNLYNAQNFELHHPLYNKILTRAVYSFKDKEEGWLFFTLFIDEQEKYPWILCSAYSLADFFITPEGIFASVRYLSSNPHDIWYKQYIRKHIKINIENDSLTSEKFIFQKANFIVDLQISRPAHYFLNSFVALKYFFLTKKINKNKLFLISKNMRENLTNSKNILNIPLRLWYCYSSKYDDISFITKEVLRDFNSLVLDEDKFDKFDKTNIDAQDLQNLIPTFYKEIANDKIS